MNARGNFLLTAVFCIASIGNTSTITPVQLATCFDLIHHITFQQRFGSCQHEDLTAETFVDACRWMVANYLGIHPDKMDAADAEELNKAFKEVLGFADDAEGHAKLQKLFTGLESNVILPEDSSPAQHDAEDKVLTIFAWHALSPRLPVYFVGYSVAVDALTLAENSEGPFTEEKFIDLFILQLKALIEKINSDSVDVSLLLRS